MEINTENLIDDVAKLAENAEKALAKLVDGSGKPIHRQDLHLEKRNTILSKFNNETSEHLTVIDNAIESLQSELSVLENYNITAMLDVDVLTRANALMPLIQAEAENTDGALLYDQIVNAMNTKDMALLYCYYKCLPNRSRTYESTIKHEDKVKTTKLYREYASELKLLYKRLEAQLTRSKERGEKAAKITSRLSEMTVAKKAIQLRARQATGKEQQILNNQREMIRSWL
jgi:hypothetical protein